MIRTGKDDAFKTDSELQQDADLKKLYARQIDDKAKELLESDSEFLDLVAKSDIKYELSLITTDQGMTTYDKAKYANRIGMALMDAARDTAKAILPYPEPQDLEEDKE